MTVGEGEADMVACQGHSEYHRLVREVNIRQVELLIIHFGFQENFYKQSKNIC